MSKILFIDDEEYLRIAAQQTFELAELPITPLDTAKKALTEIDRNFGGIIISDIRMPEMDGIKLLGEVLKIDTEIPVILVTGHGDVDLAVECMRLGAYDFIEKPYEPNRLVETARRALEKRELTLENRVLRTTLHAKSDIERRLTGKSEIILDVKKKINSLATLETDVLIVGETGTGKDLVAKILHDSSTRANMPFVYINCAALPVDMVEIELFGHEIGAFPSAVHAKYGKFEHARGGTVYLDELECLSLNVQAKILHAIEDRCVTRLGSNQPIELDVRFIAAVQNDLRDEIAQGRFRSDLYYRLSGAEIKLPTLVERKQDIPKLFGELVEGACARHKLETPKISPSVFELLIARNWPGNIRELKNVAERFVLGLDLELAAIYQSSPKQNTLSDQIAQYERALISASLQANEGRINQTYEELGISRKALYDKMQKYDLDRDDYTK